MSAMTGERLKEIRARYEKEAAGMDLRDLPRRDVLDLLTEVDRLRAAGVGRLVETVALMAATLKAGDRMAYGAVCAGAGGVDATYNDWVGDDSQYGREALSLLDAAEDAVEDGSTSCAETKP